jgi:hypothetical protein
MGADSAITLDGQSRVAMGITPYALPRRASPPAKHQPQRCKRRGLRRCGAPVTEGLRRGGSLGHAPFTAGPYTPKPRRRPSQPKSRQFRVGAGARRGNPRKLPTQWRGNDAFGACRKTKSPGAANAEASGGAMSDQRGIIVRRRGFSSRQGHDGIGCCISFRRSPARSRPCRL